MIEKEFLQEKLSQIKDDKKAFETMVKQFGEQEKKFNKGDIVKLSRNGRKQSIEEVRYGYSKFSESFSLIIEYRVKEISKRRTFSSWVSENDLVSL